MRGRAAALAIAAFLAAAPSRAESAESADRLSIDPDVSIETGSDLTRTLAGLTASLEAAAFRPLGGEGAPGIAARAARTALLDLPLAWWLGVLEHEAFGHAGRARELGARAGYHLGSPWGGRDSYASFSAEGLGPEDLLRIYAGGTESNGWTATLVERDLVAGRPALPFELLFLAANRWVDFAYVARTTPDPVTDPAGFYAEWSGGGDVASYLGYLSERATGEPGITPSGSSPLVRDNYRRLLAEARFSALDPGMWLALWSAGRAIVRGDERAPLPLPSIRGTRFLPILSADWLPDGGVASLELVARRESARDPGAPHWASVVVRHGTGPFGAIWLAGAASDRVASLGAWEVGGELEAWRQPSESLGGGIRARLTASRGRLRGAYASAGLKSAGHWPGRPLGSGPFVSLGCAFALP